MQLQKVWLNKKENEHHFILFHEDVLYRLQSKKDQWRSIACYAIYSKYQDDSEVHRLIYK